MVDLLLVLQQREFVRSVVRIEPHNVLVKEFLILDMLYLPNAL